jgi:hypothetical protein
MTTAAELSVAERLVQVLQHLGIERAHFAASPANITGFTQAHPELGGPELGFMATLESRGRPTLDVTSSSSDNRWKPQRRRCQINPSYSDHRVRRWESYAALISYAAIAVPVMSRQVWNLWVISRQYARTGRRWRRGRKCDAMGPYAERKRWACPGDLNPRMRHACWRVGWCEFSARLFRYRC